MTYFIKACVSPIRDITRPLYHLVQGDRLEERELKRLFLATFRTATVAAFFFTIIPFNYIFGKHDNLSGSCAFTAQFLIHPYAAALFNAFVNGGYPLILKGIDIVVKRQLILTRDDVGGFVRAIGFCYIAHICKKLPAFYISRLDRKYHEWSRNMAEWICTREIV